jgi:flagellar basal-body rod modification protein FlgD
MSEIAPSYGANSTNVINTLGGSAGTSSVGQDEFLAMLVTQLQYQDPLDPMDSQAFAAQLAQFTSVEQLTSINSNLESSLETQMLLNQSINNTMSAQLIGLDVRATNDIVQLKDGETTPIMYELPGNADTVTITIYDSNGNIVRTENIGAEQMGEHTYEWDGKNTLGGSLPDGDYTFTVAAKTVEGNDLEVDQFISGTITGIDYVSGQAVILLGGLPVYLPNVTSLSTPGEG